MAVDPALEEAPLLVVQSAALLAAPPEVEEVAELQAVYSDDRNPEYSQECVSDRVRSLHHDRGYDHDRDHDHGDDDHDLILEELL